MERLTKVERVLGYALIAITLVLLFVKLRSLCYYPIFDSYLWWGDESWLMLEFKEQMLHGIMRHPLAYGATIHFGNGLLVSSHWITATLYGLPAILFAKTSDPVSIGRGVTAALSIVLIASTYNVLRKLGMKELLSALGLVLLVTSGTYFLTGHSARYDILTSLALLWLFYLAAKPLSEKKPRPLIYGLLLPGLLLISTHALLLGGGLWIYGVVRRAWWKTPREIGWLVAGVVVGILLILLGAVVTGQQLTLFGSSSGTGFLRNISDIPILRPFSRSVQFANIFQKWKQGVELAPVVLGVFVLTGVAWLTNALRRGARRSWRATPTTTAALILIATWLFCESSAPTSYLIYVVPVAIVATLISLQRYAMSVRTTTVLSAMVYMLLFVIGAALSASDYGRSETVRMNGRKLTNQNLIALATAYDLILNDGGSTGKTLVENPGVARMYFGKYGSEKAGEPRVSVMTTQLVEYPASSISVDSSLRREGVRYLLLYASQLNPDFMREAMPLRAIAERRGELIGGWVSKMTDIGRSYDVPVDSSRPDSLLLFRLRP